MKRKLGKAATAQQDEATANGVAHYWRVGYLGPNASISEWALPANAATGHPGDVVRDTVSGREGALLRVYQLVPTSTVYGLIEGMHDGVPLLQVRLVRRRTPTGKQVEQPTTKKKGRRR